MKTVYVILYIDSQKNVVEGIDKVFKNLKDAEIYIKTRKDRVIQECELIDICQEL